MEIKRELCNSILLPTLNRGSETWTWNRAQQLRVSAVEMSYLRGACGVTRWEDESNESVHERSGMGPFTNRVKCGVVEWMKQSSLRWFGHIGRKKIEEFVKKVYVSEIECPWSRERPVVRWKDRVKKYVCERGFNSGRD